MKNSILRILIISILFVLFSSIVVTITGLVLKWKTSAQFSDGLFWAGAIIIAIGFVNILGRTRQPYIPYGRITNLDEEDRFKLLSADTFRGNNIMFLLGISGLLLFGLASLVLKLF
jgi:hypothetical protein